MKNYFLILIIFSTSTLFAQHKLSVAPIFSTDYSFRTLSSDANNQPMIDSRNSNEIPKIGFRVGTDFHYKISKKISIKTGMRFASAGYQNKKIEDINWASEYNALTGITTNDPSLPHELQHKYKYYFIEIPLAIRYNIGHKKLSYYIEAGLSAMLYTNNRIKQVTDIDVKYDKERVANFNHFSLSTSVSIGLQYQLNKKIVPFIQPIFRYGITPINDNPIKMNLHSLGCEFGFRYSL